MILIEQIICVLIVDLYEWNLELVGHIIAASLELLKHICEHSRNSATSLPSITSTHSESLTWSCLTIGEDSAIKTIQAVIDDWFGYTFKNVLLRRCVWEDAIEWEQMIIFSIWKLASTHLQFDWSVCERLTRNTLLLQFYISEWLSHGLTRAKI